MTSSKLQVVLVILSCTIVKIQNASLGRVSDNHWRPEGKSLDEWIRCHGMDCRRWKQVQQKLHTLASQEESSSSDSPNTSSTSTPQELTEFVLFSEEQVDTLLEESEQDKTQPQGGRVRKKRKLDSAELVELWELPIPYKFSGDHSDAEETEMELAMSHWSDHTCVRFKKIPTHQSYSDHHLLFTREFTSCYTYVGKISTIPQQINLMPACFGRFGTLVHEIGHTLGLWHEQQRWDRDKYITVNYNNLGAYYMQYRKLSTENLNVGYDMGSVMHYAPYDGTKNGQRVMNSVDPLYQTNMGQRTGLSFNDAKIINFAYCSGICTNELPQPCERGGYQNPNECTKCKCPPGYSGVYCDQLQPSDANCGGEIYLTTTDDHYITSPNYPHSYQSYTSCNWKIKAPVNYQVSLNFEGDFNVFSQSQKECFHWVEVKYKGLLDSQGPRFCGTRKPYVHLVSELDEILVIFRSDFDVVSGSLRKGFKIKLSAVPNQDINTQTSSTPQVTTTTTTVASTTQSVTSTPSSTSTTTTVPTIETSTEWDTSTTHADHVSPPTGHGSCVRVDLSFLLDSSGSVGSQNWNKSLEFVCGIIRRLSLSLDCSRVAILSFGNVAYQYSSLSDYSAGKSSVLTSVQSMPFMDQWTNTADALRTLVEDVYKPDQGDRTDVADVAILVTDGEGNVKPRTTVPTARNVTNKGITLLGIGVGSKVNRDELYDVTDNSDNVMFVDTYNNLITESFLSQIINKISALVTDSPKTTNVTTTESSTSKSSTSSTTESSTVSTTQPSTSETSTTSTTESSTASTTTTASTSSEPSSVSSTRSSTTTEVEVPYHSTDINFYCSFEDSSQSPPDALLCGTISQRQDDAFDWTLQSGPTPSEPTGPAQAFDGEYYVFIETSSPRVDGDNAVLQLPAVTTTSKYCLTFNYHMFGFHINTLNVYLEGSDWTRERIWWRVGEQGDQWLDAWVNLDLNQGDKILFEGIRGEEYSGDIALDNIHLEGC